MTTGLATRRALDRYARESAESERRGVELVGGLVTLALVAVVGTTAVLIADQITGMHLVADLIRWVRS